MSTQNRPTINMKGILQRSSINIDSKGCLALTQFTYEYTKTLISKCICLGSLPQRRIARENLITIFDSERLTSQPSIAADLVHRRQKTIDAANQNRLDDFEFKDSLSISIDRVNLLEGIQSIRLKKFNSIHLMIARNIQLAIHPKQSKRTFNFSHSQESDCEEAEIQSENIVSGIEMVQKNNTSQSFDDGQVSEHSNQNDSVSVDSLPLD